MAVTKPHIILGASGHARVLAEALAACDLPLLGHVGPEAGDGVGDYLGDDDVLEVLLQDGAKAVIGLGFVDSASMARRRDILAQIAPGLLGTVVHPSAIIAPSATLENGVFVAPGAIIGTGSSLGLGSILNSGAVVDHDCIIGANTHIATGARLAGGITVGTDCLIGVGACVRQGITIGSGSIVGAGAVVIRDVPAGATVLGVPAK